MGSGAGPGAGAGPEAGAGASEAAAAPPAAVPVDGGGEGGGCSGGELVAGMTCADACEEEAALPAPMASASPALMAEVPPPPPPPPISPSGGSGKSTKLGMGGNGARGAIVGNDGKLAVRSGNVCWRLRLLPLRLVSEPAVSWHETAEQRAQEQSNL